MKKKENQKIWNIYRSSAGFNINKTYYQVIR